MISLETTLDCGDDPLGVDAVGASAGAGACRLGVIVAMVGHMAGGLTVQGIGPKGLLGGGLDATVALGIRIPYCNSSTTKKKKMKLT